jgi:uncharacterized protein involved in exopolysaccharide biosynthesis
MGCEESLAPVKNNIEYNTSDGANMTARQMAIMLMRRWRVLVITPLVFGAVAAIIGFSMTPIYRSTALVIPSEQNDRSGALGNVIGQIGGGGLAALAGLGLGGGSQSATNEAVAILQSHQFIQKFIESNKLMPKLYEEKWDAAANDWKKDIWKVPTIEKAYKLFTGEILDVYQDKKSNLVTISITWTDRKEAADWANQLLALVNERMRAAAIEDADKTLQYLQQELPAADTVEVRRAISSMMEAQLKTKAVASVRKEYAFRVIDPAIPSDPDLRLRPHKATYILIALVMGFLAGIAIIFLSSERRKIADPRLT